MKKYQGFLSENFQFLEVKFSIYLKRRVFVMISFSFGKRDLVLLGFVFCCARAIRHVFFLHSFSFWFHLLCSVNVILS